MRVGEASHTRTRTSKHRSPHTHKPHDMHQRPRLHHTPLSSHTRHACTHVAMVSNTTKARRKAGCRLWDGCKLQIHTHEPRGVAPRTHDGTPHSSDHIRATTPNSHALAHLLKHSSPQRVQGVQANFTLISRSRARYEPSTRRICARLSRGRNCGIQEARVQVRLGTHTLS